jgi:uncharacterized short protein YbdD (DUF466 family)
MTGLDRLRYAVRSLRWFVRGVVGADAYERYLEHHRRVHPQEPPMTEKQFWRAHTDERDASPTMRCC